MEQFKVRLEERFVRQPEQLPSLVLWTRRGVDVKADALRRQNDLQQP
jgi:hypothetical protein